MNLELLTRGQRIALYKSYKKQHEERPQTLSAAEAARLVWLRRNTWYN